MKRIGIADTTFARVDMAAAARRALGATGSGYRLYRRTVPGIKDLPSACQQLFREERVELTLALGMPGRAEYDRTCAHEASLGLQQVALAEGRPILECFVFESEASTDRELEQLARRRAEEHAENAWNLLFRPRALARRAGGGLRQGFADAGPVRPG
ncbi:MAG: riboflavin synthase [Thermoplasmata archaeon]|nr:riboflavin synthase [Thermoplasmata archaeon]MCI4342464.1 riboflavin synthase [Thermoplasmata archaeon]